VSKPTFSRVHDEHRRDGGVTLIELLIVMSLIGLVATVLASAIVVTLRTAPSTELRTDDARSTRGLSTWLSQDVASTPPFRAETPGRPGFSLSPEANTCGAPDAGRTLVELNWLELDQTFFATYREERVDGSGDVTIRRYACSGAGSPTRRANLTSGLKSTAVTLEPPQVGKVTAVKFELTSRSGGIVHLVVSPRNPSEFFQ
jgi:prepilin-type N-terminal cleavage/methylation domain-containing protein